MTKVKTDAEINSTVSQSVVSPLNINEVRINSYSKFVHLRNQPQWDKAHETGRTDRIISLSFQNFLLINILSNKKQSCWDVETF